MDSNGNPAQNRALQRNHVLRLKNALLEEVMASTRDTGYVLLSYDVRDRYGSPQKNLLQLNVGKDTEIKDPFGNTIFLTELRKGMHVNVLFSSAITKSIPPQSNAFRITVKEEEPYADITTDRVVSVDTDYGFIITGNPNDIYEQMRFNISNETLILDKNGNAIPLGNIRPGQMIRAEHAIFQTMSIPPQSPAFRIQLLS